MKILFLTEPREDYLQDQVLYGLRQLLGPDLVDYPRKEVMYSNCSRDDLYGRGFTLWRLLEDISVDRSDIHQRIAMGGFDRIIFGSVRRQKKLFLSLLTRGRLWGKSSGRFIFLDGQDGVRPLTSASFFGPYFKREFSHRTSSTIAPISFSIPAQKILTTPPTKTQQFGRHVQCEEAYKLPQIRQHCASGYLFDQETDYYQDLARSHYGITMKKGGWDCMRHYEIAANHCVPAFYQLNDKHQRCAPHGLRDMENVVVFDSADELAQKIKHIEDNNAYPELQRNVVQWVNEHSCEALAQRLMDASCQ